ncbi:MAG: shikimate kinase [Clostridiales bacterium]|jgi:shikimate kinase|nr:shikimate kinase [Clostridiales bacterium]
MKNVVLIGFMGSGKTSVARCLAKKLRLNLYEMDMIIENEARLTINAIFEKYGEDYFRNRESDVLRRVLDNGNEAGIISCGGGVVMREENIRIMKEYGIVFFLEASEETIYMRLKNSTDRPLLNNNMTTESIEKRLNARLPLYKNAADFMVNTDSLTVNQVADEIIRILY